MTNVPVPVLTATGYAIPSLQSILSGVVQDFQAAYGGSINLSATPQSNGQPNSTLTTVQGQQATTLAATVYDCYSQFLAVTSQVDPQYAQGLMQDGVGNIYFMSRYPAGGTQVTGTCQGLPGTVIAAGVPAAQDGAGNIYSCAAVGGGPVTIALGGSPAIFTNMVTGPIPYVPNPIGSGLSIYQTTAGWDSISVGTSTLGVNTETTQQFETRRQMSVSVNSLGPSSAIKAAILALVPTSYPASVYVMDNPANVAVAYGGLTLPANSIYISVCGYQEFLPWVATNIIQGGVTSTVYPISSVAQAIFAKKTLGCSFAPGGIATLGSTCSTVNMSLNTPSSGNVFGTLFQANTNQPYLSSAGNGSVPLQVVTFNGATAVLNFPPATPITAGTVVWFGTAYNIPDPSYPSPQPSYYAVFTRPIPVPIQIQVTLAAASNPPPLAQQMLAGAYSSSGIPGLPASFAGTDGLPAVSQIGATVYGSRFYPQIAATLPGISILGVVVSNGGIPPGAAGPLQVPININQIPILGTITVVTQ